MFDETTTAHPACEQSIWLRDYARWRSEHRQALTLLTKIQTQILEQEAVLEAEVAEINGHQNCLRPDNCDPCVRPPIETQSAEEKLEQQRAFHELSARRYVDILSRIEELAELSEVAMWRSLT